MSKTKKTILFSLAGLVILGGILLSLPPVWSRVQPRLSQLQARVKYALSPLERDTFSSNPNNPDWIATQVQATLTAMLPTSTPTPPEPTATPKASPTPTITPTPLPQKVILKGIRYEAQRWNNCGPANLSMALSYWGWQGDQLITAAYLKPNDRDKNVMPYEMMDFVNTQTDLRALVRVGGTIDLLKSLVAAGFPVIVEKGFEGIRFEGWMGHYEVINGYDDALHTFYVQDSYNGPDQPITYDDLESYWRHFNFIFIVLYPPDKENDVLNALGPLADPTAAYQAALERSTTELYSLEDIRDQFFSAFNRGTNQVYLLDYAGAATSYDMALFAIYDGIEEDLRPARILWYQTGPYFAYYYTGQYGVVIDLADRTLKKMSEPVLEESYYWRGLAKEAQGYVNEAIADYQLALHYHEGFIPAVQALERLGVPLD